MNVYKHHVSASRLAGPVSESRQAGGRGAGGAAAPSLSPPGDWGGRPLTWFLPYHAPDREPLPAPSAQYVKFRDSSSTAAEAAAIGARSRRSGSGSGSGCLPAPPLRQAPRRRRALPRPLPARRPGRRARRGHLAPAPARRQVRLPPANTPRPARRGLGPRAPGARGDPRRLRPPGAARLAAHPRARGAWVLGVLAGQTAQGGSPCARVAAPAGARRRCLQRRFQPQRVNTH